MILRGKIINPGELRTQVGIGRRTITSPGGFPVAAYERVDTVWARWRGVHGSEAWQAQAVGAEGAATVLIRYRPGIDNTTGIQLGNDWYEVISVDDIEQRHEYIELKVKIARPG